MLPRNRRQQCQMKQNRTAVKFTTRNRRSRIRKGYLERRQIPTTECATYHNHFAFSFLQYKVTQILYNKLTQAHLPTTHSHTQKKTWKSQMVHIRKYTNYFLFFLSFGKFHMKRIKKKYSQEKKRSENFWVARFLVSWERPFTTSEYELQKYFLILLSFLSWCIQII